MPKALSLSLANRLRLTLFFRFLFLTTPTQTMTSLLLITVYFQIQLQCKLKLILHTIKLRGREIYLQSNWELVHILLGPLLIQVVPFPSMDVAALILVGNRKKKKESIVWPVFFLFPRSHSPLLKT